MSNKEQLIIRDAKIEDLPQVVEIYNSTVPSRMVTADTEPVTVESKKQWFLDHSPNFRPMWVVEKDNEICGWLSFQSFYGRPAYNATAELSIYVSENHRKEGIGKILMEKAINVCSEIGVNSLLGFIFSHNEPSLRLFKNFSFEVWGHLPKVAVLDGIERDLTIVGKRLY